MKRIIKIIALCALAMLVGFGTYYGYGYYKHNILGDKSDINGKHYVDNTHWYTVADSMIGSHPRIKEPIKYDKTLNTSDEGLYKTYYLCLNLDTRQYVKVQLPAGHDYVYNYSSNIVSTDGCISVGLYKGTINSFTVDIENPVTKEAIIYLTETSTNKDAICKYDESESKLPHSVYNFFDDMVLVGTCYSNTADYTQMVNTISSAGSLSIVGGNFESEVIKYEKPEYDPNNIQTFFTGNAYQSDYTWYDNGYLYYMNYALPRAELVRMSKAYLDTVNEDEDVTEYYINGDIRMYESAGYTLGFFKNNEQYYTLLIGYGQEARNNVAIILSNKEQ